MSGGARKIAILRGGTSERHSDSVKQGGDFLAHIFENLYPKWQPFDVFVDKSGVWHLKGREITPADLFHHVDLVWNTADPSISRMLEHLGIPVVGGDFFASMLKESRELLQSHIKRANVCLPRHMIVSGHQSDVDGPRESYAVSKAHEVFRKFPPPYAVKSASGDKNLPVYAARDFNALAHAIYDLSSAGILIEELGVGKDCTVHTVRNFRGAEVYQMMPRPSSGDIHGHNFSATEKEKIKEAVENLIYHLDTPSYAGFDLILSPRGEIYLKDLHFIPEFTEDSHFARACEDLGFKACHVLEHILESGLK